MLRLLFDHDERVNFDGKHYQLRDAVFLPKTVQRPHPPIMVGGGGEKRTLRAVARYGDVMNVFGTPEVVRKKIVVLEQHCREAGRDPAEIEKTISANIIVSENQGLIDRVAGMFGPGQGLSPEDAKKVLPIGVGGPCAGDRRAVRRHRRDADHHPDAGAVEARGLSAP